MHSFLRIKIEKKTLRKWSFEEHLLISDNFNYSDVSIKVLPEGFTIVGLAIKDSKDRTTHSEHQFKYTRVFDIEIFDIEMVVLKGMVIVKGYFDKSV